VNTATIAAATAEAMAAQSGAFSNKASCHSMSKIRSRADHDLHNYELKEGGEVHIRPDTALPLSANRR
jgi:hypothetical protein